MSSSTLLLAKSGQLDEDKGKGPAWLQLLQNGLWGCSGPCWVDAILPGSQKPGEVPSVSLPTREGALQHTPPAARLAWRLLRLGWQRAGQGST